MNQPERVVVYAGPSISREAIAAVLPGASVRAPVLRGELYSARENGATHILIIDGTFSHSLAISPREVIDVVRDGAVVFGASSMGAVRAAECWPMGMHGVGLIYRLYRIGAIDSDDEVALVMDPENGFRALSVPLINVRYTVSRAVRAGILSRSQGRQVVEVAKETFYSERTWKGILSHPSLADVRVQFERRVELRDLKHEDAREALAVFARAVRGSSADAPAARMSWLANREARYPGHDPMFGGPIEVRQEELFRWILGSGRYQRYIWPMVVGEPAFEEVLHAAPSERSEALREGLVEVLGDASQATRLAERLWWELEYLDELDAELMRWHAVRTLAAEAVRVGSNVSEALSRRVQDEVAIAQGLREWRALLDEVVDDRLFGAIPLEWITEACSNTALARARASELGRRRVTPDASSAARSK